MLTDEYVTVKELAALRGSTEKQIDLDLVGVGLWTVDGRPTRRARRNGYTGRRYYPNPLPIWHREKTLAALKEGDDLSNFDYSNNDDWLKTFLKNDPATNVPAAGQNEVVSPTLASLTTVSSSQ
jgi:hypothetical protein